MIPRDLFFASPLAIYHLLWLVPLALVLSFAGYRRKKSLGNLILRPLQPLVFSGRDPFLTGLRIFSLFLAWIFATVALMQPYGNEEYPSAAAHRNQNEKTPIDLFFLIDASLSMGVQDVRSKETRLQKAIEIADAVLKNLKSDPASLWTFTSDALPVVPLTYDEIFVRLMLREIVLNQGDHSGTLIGNALKALNREALSQYPKAPKVVLLFSDGGDNLSSESGKEKEKLLKEASELKVPIFTIGIGSREGGVIPEVLRNGKTVTSHLEEGLLKEIAAATGGRYFSASDFSPQDLAEGIQQSLIRYRLKSTEAGMLRSSKGIYKPYFQVPLGISLFFFLVFAFLPYGRKKSAILIPLILFSALHSQEPGKNLYEEGRYKEAADWYSGELKHLPPVWLRDKLFYDYGTALVADKKEEDAERAFFLVSSDAYSYPLFRLRLIYNRLLGLLALAEKEEGAKRAWLLQEGLFIAQMADFQELLKDIKKTFQVRLGDLKESEEVTDKLFILNRLIYTLQFAASLPKMSLEAIQVMFQNEKRHFEEDPEYVKALEFIPSNPWKGVLFLSRLKERLSQKPADYLKGAIEELAAFDALKAQDEMLQDAKKFYPFVLDWQTKQYKAGVCYCEPWKEALPLYIEGVQMLRAPLAETQMPYTYDKWREVLALLENPPSGGQSQQEEKENKEQLQELQEMQALDQEFKKIDTSKQKQEEMKW